MIETYRAYLTKYIDKDFFNKYYDDRNKIDLDNAVDPNQKIILKDGSKVKMSNIHLVCGFDEKYTLDKVYPQIWDYWADSSILPSMLFFRDDRRISLKINDKKTNVKTGFITNFLKFTILGDEEITINLKDKNSFYDYINDKNLVINDEYFLEVYNKYEKILRDRTKIKCRELINVDDVKYSEVSRFIVAANVLFKWLELPIRLEFCDFKDRSSQLPSYNEVIYYVNSVKDTDVRFIIMCLLAGIPIGRNRYEGIGGIKKSDIDRKNNTLNFIYDEKNYTIGVSDFFINTLDACSEQLTYIERRGKEETVRFFNPNSEYVLKSKISEKTKFGVEPMDIHVIRNIVRKLDFKIHDLIRIGAMYRMNQIQLKENSFNWSANTIVDRMKEFSPVRKFDIRMFLHDYKETYGNYNDEERFSFQSLIEKG